MPEAQQYSINALSEMLSFDRRTLKRLLVDVPPSGMLAGHPVYDLESVRAAIAGHSERRAAKSKAKDRLTDLQCQKIEVHLAIARKQYVPASDVEKWGAELGQAIRKGLLQLHLSAPEMAGLSTLQAEAKLKELGVEILQQLHLIDERTIAANANQEHSHESATQGL